MLPALPRVSICLTRVRPLQRRRSTGSLSRAATRSRANDTVNYAYDANHRLATKTDAIGTVFTYSYDGFNRLLTISVGGSRLRTYTYDQNAIDSTYSQNVNGRLATVTYPVISYDVLNQTRQGTTTFTEMFSYTADGAVAGKRLRVTKTNPYGTEADADRGRRSEHGVCLQRGREAGERNAWTGCGSFLPDS